MEIKIERSFLLTTYVLVAVLSLILGILLAPLSGYSEKEIITVPLELSSPKITHVNIAAVSSGQNVGIIGEANVEIRSGTGKVLIETNPFIETDTQYSAQISKQVAESFAKKSLSKYDVIYSYNIGANVLGGPSAGAAMALATIAAMEDKKIDNLAVITGTIESSGNIGKVGSILEKTIAVAESGKNKMLIPKDQSIMTYYERVTDDRETPFGFRVRNTKYVPQTLDLKEYMEENYPGFEVIEVSNIGEAASIMLA